MRYLEVTVPEGKREIVLEILEDEGIDYVVSDETSGRGYAAVVRFRSRRGPSNRFSIG